MLGVSSATVNADVQKLNASRSETEQLSTRAILAQSDQNDWRTPRKYLDAAREVMGVIDSRNAVAGWREMSTVPDGNKWILIATPRLRAAIASVKREAALSDCSRENVCVEETEAFPQAKHNSQNFDAVEQDAGAH